MTEVVLECSGGDVDGGWELQERIVAFISEGKARIEHQRRENCWDEWSTWKTAGSTLSFTQLKIVSDIMEAMQRCEDSSQKVH